MRKIATVSALASVIALTGLAGAAYASDGHSSAPVTAGQVADSSGPHAKVDGHGKAIACVISAKPGTKLQIKDPKGVQRDAMRVLPGVRGGVVFSRKGVATNLDKTIHVELSGTVKLNPSEIKKLPPLPKPGKGEAAHCMQVPAGQIPPGLPGLPAVPPGSPAK